MVEAVDQHGEPHRIRGERDQAEEFRLSPGELRDYNTGRRCGRPFHDGEGTSRQVGHGSEQPDPVHIVRDHGQGGQRTRHQSAKLCCQVFYIYIILVDE